MSGLTAAQVEEFASKIDDVLISTGDRPPWVRRLIQRIAFAAESVAIERAAKIAERVVGGFTANIRIDESEQELVPDPDGPWVLNSDVAKAIRASRDTGKGAE